MTVDPLWKDGVQVFDYVTERGLAGFDFQALNSRWLKSTTFVNQASAYGITVAAIAETNKWRALGAYHLTGKENGGRQNLFVDVLGEDGKRITNAVISWTVTDGGDVRSKRLDKPADEPGCDIPMSWGDTLSVWVSHDGVRSDVVVGFSTRHENEDSGNARAHHSFFVSFQRQKSGVVIDPDPPDETDLAAEVAALKGKVAEHDVLIRRMVTLLDSWQGDGK
jgi:hypothetical protein